MIWSKYDTKPSAEAVEAAKNADVVVAVLGITSELEGEEMPVDEDGFKGGDRLSLDLPKPEQELLEAVAATGKPVVLVLANGSALSVNWAKQNVNAILESWYAGEEAAPASQKLSPEETILLDVFLSPSTQESISYRHLLELRDKRHDITISKGAAVVSVRIWTELHNVLLQEPHASEESNQAGDPLVVDVTVTNTGKR